MTPLDLPAAAARRQWAIDRMVEDLVEWGCPADAAEARARQLFDRVLDVGYALPVALQSPPRRGGGSTEEGRRAARAVFEAARRMGREPAQQPHGDPDSPPQVGEQPRNAPSASQGVAP